MEKMTEVSEGGKNGSKDKLSSQYWITDLGQQWRKEQTLSHWGQTVFRGKYRVKRGGPHSSHYGHLENKSMKAMISTSNKVHYHIMKKIHLMFLYFQYFLGM